MNDRELIYLFEMGTFPFEEWNHRAHLKVAYLLLMRYPFAEATRRMRRGLQHLIRKNQVPETSASGYHETITGAWLRLVDTCLREHGRAANADGFLEQHPQLCNKRVLRLFYSQERILSPQAKARFVEPDLAPLPRSEKPVEMLERSDPEELVTSGPLPADQHRPY